MRFEISNFLDVDIDSLDLRRNLFFRRELCGGLFAADHHNDCNLIGDLAFNLFQPYADTNNVRFGEQLFFFGLQHKHGAVIGLLLGFLTGFAHHSTTRSLSSTVWIGL